MVLEFLVTAFQLPSCTLQGLTSLLMLPVCQAIGRLCSLSVSLKVLLCFNVSFACTAEIWSSRFRQGSSDTEFFDQAHNKLRNKFQTHHNIASDLGICNRTRVSDPSLTL